MKRRILYGLCGALLVYLSSCGSDTTYNAGMTALQNKNYAKAYELLQESDDPRAAEVLEDFMFVPVEGRFVSTSNEKGSTVTYTYDDKGYLTKFETTEKGIVSPCEYTYDSEGRLLTVLEPDGNMEQYGYDAAGNRVFKKRQRYDEEQYREEYQYDDQNRRIGQIDTDTTGKSVYQWAYDAAGNLTKFTVQYADGSWSESVAKYDEKGHKIWARNRDSHGMDNQMQYEYDAEGRCVLENYLNRGTVEYTYNQDGRLTSKKTMQGARTEYTYGEAGCLVMEKTIPLAGSVIKESTVVYAYNEEGSIASETLVSGDMVHVYSYTYDAYGNLLTKRFTNQEKWVSEYTYRWAVYYYPDGLPETVEELLQEWADTQPKANA